MANEKSRPNARLDGIVTSSVPIRMFDCGRSRSRVQALWFGTLVGSVITVVILVLALVLSAGFGQWNQGMS